MGHLLLENVLIYQFYSSKRVYIDSIYVGELTLSVKMLSN